ncbi:MAG: transcriptional regulator, partial [Phycisphaerae bacterium]
RSISDGKEPPDYTRSDAHRVEVVLNGRVQDPAFLKFLEKASSRSQTPFSTEDLIALDRIRGNKTIPDEVRDRLVHLEELGALERIGRGRGSRYILSKGMYQALGKKGVYTRRRGLDRRTNMELLLLHVRDNPKQGSQLSELMQVVPSLSRTQVQTLLQKLRSDGKVVVRGKTKGARWFPAD